MYNHDISRLKRTEEKLRQERERAEAANHAKSDFLANVSHELRTPMNGVLGMAGLLKDSALDGEQKELVDTMICSGQSLMMLLNDILDLSKIEANELNLEQTPFNLSVVMRDTMRLFEPLTARKGLELRYQYNPMAPECFIGDPARLRQVVTNLMGNAVKFTATGSVRLDISSCRRDDGRVDMLFRVDDTGIGIDEAHIGKIFEKFTQADSSTTRKYGGTGLGLTICKLLAEAMGGRIGVESRVGKGSSFWFTVPLPLADALQNERLSNANQNNTNLTAKDIAMDVSACRVLVVDDHPVNLFIAKKLLTKLGFQHIETADDGKTALEESAKTPFDLIILDCQMPGMDGYEVSRALRAREEGSGRRIPIVAMTANAMVGDREKCVEAGMDDYVSKPIDAARMREVLAKWLGGGGLTAKDEASVAVDPPVDMAHLRSHIGDDEEEHKIVAGLFFNGVKESIAKLETAITQGDNDAWKRAAHKLQGSAANIGANKVRALSRRAEEMAEAAQDDKSKILQEIALACEDVRTFMSN